MAKPFSAILTILILLIAGAILAAPVIGVLSAAALQSLYDISIEEPTLLLLMRHRAVLFGCMGLLLIASVWVHAWRTPAMLTALVSLVAFCVLFALDGLSHNAAIVRLFRVDLGLILALCLGLGMHWRGAGLGNAGSR